MEDQMEKGEYLLVVMENQVDKELSMASRNKVGRVNFFTHTSLVPCCWKKNGGRCVIENETVFFSLVLTTCMSVYLYCIISSSAQKRL